MGSGDINLGADFFAGNREALREAFGGSAPIVITGNSLIQRSGDSAYPFVQDSHFWYLTGIIEPGLTLVMDKGSEYLIVPQHDEHQVVFGGAVDFEAAARGAGIGQILSAEDGWSKLARRLKRVKHVATLQPPATYIDQLDMFINPSRARLVGRILEMNPDLELIDLRTQLTALRMVKSKLEIAMIKQAIKETAKLFQIIDKKREKVEGEQDLHADMQRYLIKNGLEFAYDPVIASGTNALTLHYVENNSPLDQKAVLLLDVGVKLGGYNADITRSVVSKPTKRQQAVYDAVLTVHQFACSLLKPGTDMQTYEQAVQHFMGEKLRELGLIRTINEGSVGMYFPHRTSHFLGVDVHDAADYERSLAPGMVLTVEPGIYIPEEGIGIRLEDDILITENGNENLSEQLPKVISSLTIRS